MILEKITAVIVCQPIFKISGVYFHKWNNRTKNAIGYFFLMSLPLNLS